MPKVKVIDDILIRTPVLPEETSLSYENILKLFRTNPLIRTAIYYASNSFYEALCERGDVADHVVDRPIRSLYKYIARMSKRCTPFGLFSTVNVIPFDKGSMTQAESMNEIILRLRLDAGCLSNLVEKISSSEILKQYYYINNTCFPNGDYLIYQSCNINNGIRRYKNQQAELDIFLKQVLKFAKQKFTFKDVYNSLKELDDSLNSDEVEAYFSELVKSQILINETEPNLTGKYYLDRIIDDRLVDEKYLNSLTEFRSRLLETNHSSVISVEKIRSFHSLASNLVNDNQIPEQNFLQIDAAKTIKFKERKITHNLGEQLEDLFNFLYAHKGEQIPAESNISLFKKKFKVRYNTKAVPLAIVLNSELGLGYPVDSSSNETKLTSKIPIIPKTSRNLSVLLGPLQQYIFSQIIDKGNSEEIDLSELENSSEPTKRKYLPYIFSSLISFVEDDQVFVKVVRTNTALDLISRFSGIESEIDRHIEKIAHLESENYRENGFIVAELCHHPFKLRLANILTRSSNRPYEVPYFTLSGKDSNQQILIQDLHIYLDESSNQFMFFSKSHNKHVIINHSNAFNLELASNPVFKFLCDIQFQHKPNLYFSLGAMPRLFKKLPRIKYKNFILSRAQWTFHNDEVRLLKSLDTSGVKRWRMEKGITPKVLLKKQSKELYIDFEEDFSIEVFVNDVKNLNTFTLYEYLKTDVKYALKDQDNKGFSNEVVITSKLIPDSSELLKVRADTNILNAIPTQGNIFLNGDWTYYNVYCGLLSANEVLKEFSKLIVTENWFFIRYQDEFGFHIRLRFKVSDDEAGNRLRRKILDLFNSLYSSGLITNINQAVYERELDRYGLLTFDDYELLFCADSHFYAELLKVSCDMEGDIWKIAILSLDYLLNDFSMSLEQKINFTEIGKLSFGKEFNLNSKIVKSKLNSKYSSLRIALNELFSTEKNDREVGLVKDLLNKRSKLMQDPIQRISDPKPGVLHSVVHMNFNRLFLSDARFNEFVIYFIAHRNYTARHYKSKI